MYMYIEYMIQYASAYVNMYISIYVYTVHYIVYRFVNGLDLKNTKPCNQSQLQYHLPWLWQQVMKS